MMSSGRALRISERVYRALLIAYPKEFRDAYGPHMTQVFRNLCREEVGRAGLAGLLALWARMAPDLLVTGLAERRNVSAATGRIERFRYALMLGQWREPSRGLLWFNVALWAFMIVLASAGLYLDPEDGLGDLAMIAAGLANISLSAGELLYKGRRNLLAGLLWASSVFAFTLLVATLFAVIVYSTGRTFGFLIAVFFLIILLVLYSVSLWRYLFVGSSNVRQR